jgi:Tfp pilus assembly protein PilE
MTNPLVHALVFGVAVIIPGGLLAYFAWRTYKKRLAIKAADTMVQDAQDAYRKHFPVQTDSLRVRERRQRLMLHKTRPRNKPPE